MHHLACQTSWEVILKIYLLTSQTTLGCFFVCSSACTRKYGSLKPGKGRVKQLKKKLIIPLTKNEMMARQFLIYLANRVEEEMEWTVELEDRDAEAILSVTD